MDRLYAGTPHRQLSPRSLRLAFTLVELLVVIAIIGILVALLLPAVQAARESARRSQCTSQVKNMVLAMVNLEASQGQLPSSGWAGHWSGDPERGTSGDQPGNWLFSILPYIEEQAIYDLGSGVTGAARETIFQERDATPIKIANCPSRRDGGPYRGFLGRPAQTGDGQGGVMQYLSNPAARADYAANVGDETSFDDRCLQISPNQFNGPFPAGWPPRANVYSGVSFCGTAVELRQITDGLSKTIALGEKWVPVNAYQAEENFAADDWGMYVGFQDDTVRSTFYDGRNSTHVPQPDSADITAIQGVRDQNDLIPRELFGSAHPGGCIVGMCDGSVTLVAYDIEPETFRQMGHRADDGEIKVFDRRGPR